MISFEPRFILDYISNFSFWGKPHFGFLVSFLFKDMVLKGMWSLDIISVNSETNLKDSRWSAHSLTPENMKKYSSYGFFNH